MVGDILREERERQELSIQDVEDGTSIRSRYIEAIELGNWSRLPGAIYAKGFVRNYARFLKMDVERCMNQYMEDCHLGKGLSAVPLTSGRLGDSTASSSTSDLLNEAADLSRLDSQSKAKAAEGNRIRTGAGRSAGGKLVPLLVVAVLAGGAAYASGMLDPFLAEPNQQAAQAPSAKAQKPTKHEATPATANPPAPAAAPAVTNAESKVPDPIHPDIEIHAHFTDPCWMKVTADGQLVYEGTATKGETLVWTAKEQMLITAGNAGAVEITQNGIELGRMGDYGKVVDQTFEKGHQGH